MAHISVAVSQHLLAVTQDPDKMLDEFLLRKIDEKVAETLPEENRNQLFGAIQELIPTLQQDSSPITTLVLRLIQPSTVNFEQVDALLTQNGVFNDQYIKGLESQDSNINILTLNLLNKAISSPSCIGLVASKVDVVETWIKIWLITPDVGVSSRAAEVLKNFLLAGVDCDQATVESNLMVRRIFRDRDVYDSIYSLCSLKTLGVPGQPNKNQKTIAQTRLLDLLVKVDHLGSPIRTSQFSDIEKAYGVAGDQQQGLLHFGFTKMVEYEDDELMLSTFISHCHEYLVKMDPKSGERSMYALTFLKANQLHRTCLLYFLKATRESDSWSLLSSVKYLAGYSSVWRDDFLTDKALCVEIVGKLSQRFSQASRIDWHSSGHLNADLLVLGVLPKSLLLPRFVGAVEDGSPLFQIPADASSARVIDELRNVLCQTPNQNTLREAAISAVDLQADRMTARVLYLYYHKRNPNLWSEMIKIADTVAFSNSALAAINFMYSFVDADWAPVDKKLMPSLPSEAELSQMRGGASVPDFGIEAMIFEHGVAEVVLPYVLAPPKTSVLGMQALSAVYDGEDPARTVAKAKSELTVHILERLKAMERTPEIDQILEVFSRQVKQNLRAETTVEAGGSVATMRR